MPFPTAQVNLPACFSHCPFHAERQAGNFSREYQFSSHKFDPYRNRTQVYCSRSGRSYHSVVGAVERSPKLAKFWNYSNLSVLILIKSNQIKSSLYSPYYAETCNEWRGPSLRLSAWATQLRRNVATVASRWRHCVDVTGPGIEPQTSRTDSVRLATELAIFKD